MGFLLISVCAYLLGCEPNDVLDALPSDLRPGTVLPGSVQPSNQNATGGLPSNGNAGAASGSRQPGSPQYPGQANGPIYPPSGNPSAGNNQPGYTQPTSTTHLPGQLVSNPNAQHLEVGLPVRTGNSILIATFNIQVLGRTKIGKPEVAERLATIIRLFDIVAIQEVRDNTYATIPELIRRVNSVGADYDYLISPPLGRTSSKEQYVYVYNRQTIIGSQDATYVVDDSKDDYLHREPFVARFVTRIPAQYNPFTFTLVNIHTDPGEVAQEIPVMHTVLKAIRDFEYRTANEDDVLLMGDLNVPPKDFGELGRLPGIKWLANEPTNTARTKIYDNILFDQNLTNEFTGRSGVLQLDRLLGITRDEELAISDHLPVWAEFTITEQPHYFGAGNVANSPNTPAFR